MKFTPKSEKELAEANLWPLGEYDYEILECEEATDKKDRPMFKMKVKVFKESGATQNIFDYVSPSFMEFKLRHLAEASGLLIQYETGELDAYEFVGKTGVCKVNISKDKTGQYPDRNGIADYIVGTATKDKTIDETLDNDSLPF